MADKQTRALLANAVNATIAAVNDRDFAKVTKGSYDFFTDDLAPHIKADDTANLLMACSVATGDKDALAVLVGLGDRLLLAWNSGGGFRMKISVTAVPYSTITATKAYRRRGTGRFTPEVDALCITADQTWDIAMTPSANNQPIAVLVAALTR